MSKISLKEAKEMMLDMWGWLAQNPDKEKHDFIEQTTNPLFPKYNNTYCPACTYAKARTTKGDIDDICDECPLDWWGAGECQSTVGDYIDRFGGRAKWYKYIKVLTNEQLNRAIEPYEIWEEASGTYFDQPDPKLRARKFAALEMYKMILQVKV